MKMALIRVKTIIHTAHLNAPCVCNLFNVLLCPFAGKRKEQLGLGKMLHDKVVHTKCTFCFPHHALTKLHLLA